MALNLVTLAEYKTYAGITSTKHDTIINFLIPRISQFVKNYCKRTFVDFVDTPRVEIQNGGTPYLLVDEPPILSITSLQYSTDYGQTYTTLTKFTDWVDDNNIIYPISDLEFPKKIRGYKITYSGGYNDVPTDLALAVLDMISYYRSNDGVVNAVKQTNSTSMQIEYISSTSLPAYIRRILDGYVLDYT